MRAFLSLRERHLLIFLPGRPITQLRHEIACKSAVVAAEFSPAGDLLAIAERHLDGVGHNRLWLCRTGAWEQAADLPADKSRSLHGIAFNHDGRRLAAVTGSGACQVWDTASGEQLSSFTRANELHCVTFDPRFDRIVVGGEDASVYLHGETEGFAVSLEAHLTHSIESLSFSRDARLLVTASRDGKAILWRQPFTGDSPAVAQRVLQHSDRLWCARLSPDGRMLVAVDRAGQVYRHDLAARFPSEPLRLPVAPHPNDGSARFLGDGDRFATIAQGIEIREPLPGVCCPGCWSTERTSPASSPTAISRYSPSAPPAGTSSSGTPPSPNS